MASYRYRLVNHSRDMANAVPGDGRGRGAGCGWGAPARHVGQLLVFSGSVLDEASVDRAVKEGADGTGSAKEVLWSLRPFFSGCSRPSLGVAASAAGVRAERRSAVRPMTWRSARMARRWPGRSGQAQRTWTCRFCVLVCRRSVRSTSRSAVWHPRPGRETVGSAERSVRITASIGKQLPALRREEPFTPGTVVRSRPATVLRPAPAAPLRPAPTTPLEQPIGGGVTLTSTTLGRRRPKLAGVAVKHGCGVVCSHTGGAVPRTGSDKPINRCSARRRRGPRRPS